MQDYTYSVFSIVAIAIHLIINFDLLIGRREATTHSARYRGFLLGILAYYITDATWGILAGLGWTKVLYVETFFFFLSLVAFVFMWGRFVIDYLDLGKWTTKAITWSGVALLAFNVAAMVANPFNNCFFYFDDLGNYRTGIARDVAFSFLVAFNVLIAAFVFARALGSKDSIHRRSIMVFLSCIVMALAIVLQVFFPLTPFTALGCLVGTCFLHVFVIQDEQTTKHTAELENALERARAAEKARNTFFSIVSHDIRTPLNAILGYAELLQNGICDEAEKAEALKSIRASGTTLLQLVNDVLDLAKIDSGRMTLKPTPVRLDQLADEVFSSFHRGAAEKRIKLVDHTEGVPALVLDSHRLRQILFNLIGNAVKFTENGSVTVSASYDGKTLEIAVSDTGCGIAPDMLSKIFDPFVQAQDPSHSAYNEMGTGLGLSICRRLVDVMGGKLAVESELGKGTTFRISIPDVAVSEERLEHAAVPESTSVMKNLPKRVLVVDDSPVNRSVLKAFLSRAGVVSVSCATNGREALEQIEAAVQEGKPHDFVFSDFWMPDMNGLEFIEKLRADSRFRDLPVFAVTADTECHGDHRADLFTGILHKPITFDKLVGVFAAR